MSDETCNAMFDNFEAEKELRKRLANLRIERAMKDLEITQIEARIEECQTIAADHQWREWLEANNQGGITQGQIRPRHLSVVPPPASLTPAPEAEPGSDALEIPEGFTKWEGGECPVAEDQKVEVAFVWEYNPKAVDTCTIVAGDGNWTGKEQVFTWGGKAAIIAYRILSEPAGEGETRDEAEPQPTPYASSCILKSTQQDAGLMFGETREVIQGEVGREFPNGEGYQHVVDAEPAPVLRADVPPDAVTYLAPSGELFVTFNGSTHLVISDESEAQSISDTPAAQAYSAAHEQDEPVSLDQMDDLGITDPNASAMLRMMTARKLEEA